MHGASIRALELVYLLVNFDLARVVHAPCVLNIGASVQLLRLYGTMLRSDLLLVESREQLFTVFIIRTISRMADSTLVKSFPSCAFSRKIRLQTKSKNSS